MSAHLRGDIFRGGITQFPECGELMLINGGRSSNPNGAEELSPGCRSAATLGHLSRSPRSRPRGGAA